MSKRGHVSLSVIRRLPRYYRFLGDLMRIGFSRISSQELSQRMGFTASQIRQDLNCFGGFGQQGYGYNVDLLHSELGTIMGTDMAYPIIIIGAGNIGRALAMNIDFSAMGFRLSAIFDNNPAVIGTSIAGRRIMDVALLDSYCRENRPVAAVLTLPRSAAPSIASRLVDLGVKAFWNFSHYDFSVKYREKGIIVENVHLGDSLMTLCYLIKNSSGDESTIQSSD